MDPVVVREPAIPSLPTSMGCGPGSDSDNSVDTVEFKEWCRVVLDKAKKNMNWQKVAEEHRKLVDGKTYYAKVKICDLPGERELYLLLWPAGSSTRTHGHPGLGCVQTLLEGEVKEMRYPAKGGWASTNTLLPGTVAYINDDIAYHKVENISSEWAYSLHLYPKL